MIETLLTVHEYEIASAALEASGVHVSLIDGRIVKKVSSTDQHTQVINRLIAFIQMHLIDFKLPGVLVSQTTGFQFTDTHCPEPDIAYVQSRTAAKGDACIANDWPNFIIEVASDSKRREEHDRLERDRSTWLDRGAVVYETWPESKLIEAFNPDGSQQRVTETLTFAVLPELKIPLARVFD